MKSGNFAHAREPLDAKVKHSTHGCWSVAQGGGRGFGVGEIHTDTTRGDICGNHDGALARLELVQDPIALVLLLVTVDGCKELAGVGMKRGRGTHKERASHPGGGSG